MKGAEQALLRIPGLVDSEIFAETTLLQIPGIVEAQVFVKAIVRCELPMTDDMIAALQAFEEQIKYNTGWKVEMTVNAGKRPPRKPPRTPDRFRGI